MKIGPGARVEADARGAGGGCGGTIGGLPTKFMVRGSPPGHNWGQPGERARVQAGCRGDYPLLEKPRSATRWPATGERNATRGGSRTTHEHWQMPVAHEGRGELGAIDSATQAILHRSKQSKVLNRNLLKGIVCQKRYARPNTYFWPGGHFSWGGQPGQTCAGESCANHIYPLSMLTPRA